MREFLGKIGQWIRNAYEKKAWGFDLVVSFLLAFICCLFASTSLSPLYPAINYDFINLDANFFLYSAKLLLAGKTPYLEVYDHKGLYHLAIDCLGLWLGGGSRYGVWALEIVFTFVTLLFLLRAVRLVSASSKRSYLAAIAVFFFFRATISAGNIEGEWVLPFISLYFYFYVKAIVTKKDVYFLWGSFFMGLEVGLAFNSRPLDALWGGSGAIAYLVYWIRNRKGISLLWNTLIALGACLIPYAIVIPLAIQGNYLSAMMSAIWGQNMSYIQRDDTPWNTAMTRILIIGFLLVGLLYFLLERKNQKDKKELNVYFLVTTIVTCLLYLAVMRYYSYIYSGLGFYALATSYAIASMKEPFRRFSFSKTLIGVCLGAYVVWNAVFVSFYYTVGLADFSLEQSLAIQKEIVDTIPQKDRETEGKVFALGCDASVYLDGDIIVTERFFCNQAWWSTDNAEVIPEVESYLSSSEKPTWLLVSLDAATQSAFQNVIATNYVTTSVKNAHFEIYQAIV